MSRARTPRSAGDVRKRENQRHLQFLARLAMPEGIPRAELVDRYTYDAGLTDKKANEHIDHLIRLNVLLEDDMRIFLGFNRDEANLQLEADRLSRAYARTQKASDNPPGEQQDPSQRRLPEPVIPDEHASRTDKKTDTRTRTQKGEGSAGSAGQG